MKPNYFSIPNPCSADWNKMTPTEQGAFCKQCNKEVIDLYPVPSDQIKETIAAKNNPCIRILQSQIDEMNFAEWFRSLALTKQLRYLFLFTLLLVFQNKSQAQETDTTFIPYSNEYLDELALEKPDSTEFAEIDNEENQNIDSISTTIFPGVEIGSWDVVHPIQGEGWMGVPPIIYEDFVRFDVAVVGGYILTEIPEDPPIKNQIILDENTYEFTIIEKELHFIYKSIKNQKIRIKITHENGEVVYFAPLELGIGENSVIYPIQDFEFGHYTIVLETEKHNGSTKVIYL